ncbi:hypothetical protein [Arcanobacterium pinnipediorum]|uniref:Uncharacterized protein n=1 Tax=Arcanobacterium pinnipediorum TaxID=1503041 RepID=A0ABY5AIX9_9ACTO|nr:hypothetical protein [Arcanobacterium pinnipediorum]USR79945.1 hypothetical protein NG665_02910 [Arcanobacterium pinnipediorum]
MKSAVQSAVATILAILLAVGSTGSANATELHSSNQSLSLHGTTIQAESSARYPEPSVQDILLFGTDDPETVYLLNQMSEDFAKFGDKGAYDSLIVGSDAPIRPGTITTQDWNSFASCVGSGLAQSFGLDVLKRAFDSQVRNALKSHQWKVASSIMHRNLTRLLGKKGASFVIKKIAAKALPGGLPGQIAW